MSELVLDVGALAGDLRAALAAEPARLDLVALAIARLGDRAVDDAAVLALLDGWGDRIRERARGSVSTAMDAIERLLVGELDLHGDEDDYDDPRNSFLPEVLERRRGLPILLSLVYLEVARRAGVPMFGIALPGHFVVGYRTGTGTGTGTGVVVLDPFRRAQILDRAGLEAVVARAGARFSPAMITAAPARSIAIRMLRNLIGSFARRGRRDRVQAAAALLLALEPGDAGALDALARAVDGADN
ncbi:MAG TPA: transglutaminase-like domain-containing protein [Kofleriaceae bacterium]|nr:transglutaminase-like domain-containing protein [Kofleriaceae bacterium]